MIEDPNAGNSRGAKTPQAKHFLSSQTDKKQVPDTTGQVPS